MGLNLKYECNSYRASDPKDTMRIQVTPHMFNAFARLGSALRKLRLPHRTRFIWADQICINQNDVVERNSQVQKMRGFYERAEGVVAELGPLSSGDDAFR